MKYIGKDALTMPTQTDMARIRAVAEEFLDREFEFDEDYPTIVYHPFFDSQVATVPKDYFQAHITDNIQFQEVAGIILVDMFQSPEAWDLCIDAKSWVISKMKTPDSMFMFIRKEYRFEFLKAVLDFLSEEDFAKVFCSIWVLSEGPNETPVFTQEELIDMFAKCDPKYIMDEDELEVFRNLPDELTIYRGVTQRNKENVRALSWTLSEEKAKWFSERPIAPFAPAEKDGIVYRANIDKKDIFAYFDGRNEKEIIVNPAKLKNITALKYSEQ